MAVNLKLLTSAIGQWDNIPITSLVTTIKYSKSMLHLWSNIMEHCKVIEENVKYLALWFHSILWITVRNMVNIKHGPDDWEAYSEATNFSALGQLAKQKETKM